MWLLVLRAAKAQVLSQIAVCQGMAFKALYCSYVQYGSC